MSDNEMLKPHEVSKMLGLSLSTLSTLRKNGMGPKWHKLGGGETSAVRYKRSDVDEFMKIYGDISSKPSDLTERGLAKRLGVTVHTLRKWRTQGKGPAFYKAGYSNQSPVRYRLRAVVEYEKACKK